MASTGCRKKTPKKWRERNLKKKKWQNSEKNCLDACGLTAHCHSVGQLCTTALVWRRRTEGKTGLTIRYRPSWRRKRKINERKGDMKKKKTSTKCFCRKKSCLSFCCSWRASHYVLEISSSKVETTGCWYKHSISVSRNQVLSTQTSWKRVKSDNGLLLFFLHLVLWPCFVFPCSKPSVSVVCVCVSTDMQHLYGTSKVCLFDTRTIWWVVRVSRGTIVDIHDRPIEKRRREKVFGQTKTDSLRESSRRSASSLASLRHWLFDEMIYYFSSASLLAQ